MRALVTGIAGFIGSHLADALIDRGDEVRGIDDLSHGFDENVPKKAELVNGDIGDADTIDRAMRGIDVVFHQAAVRSVPRSVDDPLASDRANTLGTLRVLMAAHACGVRRVVYASSSSVYGDPSEPLRVETQRPEPRSPYAVAKLAGEHYCGVWAHTYGLSTVSLRYFNVFGPRQRPDSQYSNVFPGFVSALAVGRAPEVHWDGGQSRDFTYVSDVVRANLLAADARTPVDGAVMNIGAGRGHTINETLRSVADAMGIWIDPMFKPKRPGDVRDTLADTRLAKTLLGWEAQTAWEDGVKAVVAWFRR